MITTLLLSMLFTTGTGVSYAAPAADVGYVVRVDGLTVYLDLGAEAGAKPGQAFLLYNDDEELKHPKTGKVLGRIEVKLAEGRITEVKPGFSIGTIPIISQALKTGSRARLIGTAASVEAAAPPAPAASAAPAAAPQTQVQPQQQGVRTARWKSPILDVKATGIAVADFDGDGAPDLALSDERRVYLFSYPPESAKPKSVFKHPSTKPNIVSLEAGDLNGNGKAELFASLHNQTFGRVETVVLEAGADGQWTKAAEFPWLVRAHQDPDGKSRLAVQQLVEGPFPYSNIYTLTYADGKYGPSKETIRHKRVDWLYSFTSATFPGEGTALLYMTSTDRLRVQFEDGKTWSTDDAFSQTPNRIGWAGKILECHPASKVVYGADANPSIYLIKNHPAWGGLAQPFGKFAKAELQRQRWSGLALETDWKSDLTGYATGMSLVTRPGAAGPELALAVTGTTGRSAVWIYDP